MALTIKDKALLYHSHSHQGKLEVFPVKPCKTQEDLSLAYSPGVAEACLAIVENKENAFLYTNKGNLVGVISNGTAVLGLGNIGPEAAKPVMEGKGLLFKMFADIDCYDINIKTKTPEETCTVVKSLEPTFGAINLEDIKAPECFIIEEQLKKDMNIPVFHDDQHGTAIVSAAALINALDLTGKKIENIRVVISGAGSAAIGCGRLFKTLGVTPEHIAMFDSCGHINYSRTDLNKEKKEFSTQKMYTSLTEAMNGADFLLGCSVADAVTQNMVKSMAKKPIIFACANPTPEISYTDVKDICPEAIVATGRSDFPNQVNNVLAFPFIFRGALDVQATTITEEMKIAAAYSIAQLAREPVPDYVCKAFGVKSLSYGIDYIIPKIFDMRLMEYVSTAVARSAIDCGVARKKINLENYKRTLNERLLACHKRQEMLVKSY